MQLQKTKIPSEVFRGKMHLRSQRWFEIHTTKIFTSSNRLFKSLYRSVLRLVLRCENFGPLHFRYEILACILQNSENIRQI